ncbi:MAG TPA: penicillin acylase family protein [Candidatus Acidoferrales bacterium]|nr:penicillin acylase family protein [Candidatus Acidoferrales bacterium]
MVRSRRRALLNLAASLLFGAGTFYISLAGAGPLPALGPVLNPGSGAWTAAADALLPGSQSLRLAGLAQPVTVIFESSGVTHIGAQSDHDLYLTLGYLHARYRLFEMDLLRREGSGRLAEVFGPAALATDEFELDLGLNRTAQQELDQLAPGDPTRALLEAYAQGVNLRIQEDERSGNLPLLFKLIGYRPGPWTELDSFLIKGVQTQSLAFQEAPVDFSLLSRAVGPDRALQWLPVQPPNLQHPYAPGPYGRHQPAPLPLPQPVGDAEFEAAGAVAQRLQALPAWAVARGGNSNNWAVDGTLTASGLPLMAGDPHLSLTLPGIWFWVDLSAPGLQVAGVTIPGTPSVVIGRNQHISWSLTNTQNQSTLYYREQTDPQHPGQYFWNGAWRQFQKVSYQVRIKGQKPVAHVVSLSVHGPLLTVAGEALAVTWMGNLPSQDGAVLDRIARAADFKGFREALRDWHAPSQNFVYADDRGHIGLISAGYYPLVRQGNPYAPLPGTGEFDVAGTIPFDDIPQAYDPPSHLLVTANQRPVGPDYPYYIGTAHASFDPGYRANEIYGVLSAGRKLTVADMQRLQMDSHDYLAGRMVPKLIEALSQTQLTSQQQQARALLQGWNGVMDAGSPAAAIWWTFWHAYLEATFQPWWSRYQVKVGRDGLEDVLSQDLETWTLRDPQNPTFTPPGGARRSAGDVMISAFATALDRLGKQMGGEPQSWRWGRIHTRTILSLAGISSLAYGPRGASGDAWTPNAARGNDSRSGPSWRMVVDWGSRQAYGVFPGGQAENPVSDWYRNQVETWWSGGYYPMLSLDQARSAKGAVSWRLSP